MMQEKSTKSCYSFPMQALSAEGSTSSVCFNVSGLQNHKQQDVEAPSWSQCKLSAE